MTTQVLIVVGPRPFNGFHLGGQKAAPPRRGRLVASLDRKRLGQAFGRGRRSRSEAFSIRRLGGSRWRGGRVELWGLNANLVQSGGWEDRLRTEKGRVEIVYCPGAFDNLIWALPRIWCRFGTDVGMDWNLQERSKARDSRSRRGIP